MTQNIVKVLICNYTVLQNQKVLNIETSNLSADSWIPGQNISEKISLIKYISRKK